MVAEELLEALARLGDVLADRGFQYELAMIGGGALAIEGVIDRPTKDLDVVALVEGKELRSAVPLPAPLVEAVADVARIRSLDPKWLNSGPGSLMRFGLPAGFLSRCTRRIFGTLTVQFAGRYDQIHFKLYAAADDKPGGKHHRDLQQLVPTPDELLRAAAWARTHDPSEGFSILVDQVLASFGVQT